jgi:Abortive infection C-terminus
MRRPPRTVARSSSPDPTPAPSNEPSLTFLAAPAQAIGSAKELLETSQKAVLGVHGTGRETKLGIPKLIKRANLELGPDAGTVRGDEPGTEQRRKVFGSLAQIVNSAAELRNSGLGTGHGVSQGPVLDVATARLAVSAAVAVATFYAEAHAALDPPWGASPDFSDVPF